MLGRFKIPCNGCFRTCQLHLSALIRNMKSCSSYCVTLHSQIFSLSFCFQSLPSPLTSTDPSASLSPDFNFHILRRWLQGLVFYVWFSLPSFSSVWTCSFASPHNEQLYFFNFLVFLIILSQQIAWIYRHRLLPWLCFIWIPTLAWDLWIMCCGIWIVKSSQLFFHNYWQITYPAFPWAVGSQIMKERNIIRNLIPYSVVREWLLANTLW